MDTLSGHQLYYALYMIFYLHIRKKDIEGLLGPKTCPLFGGSVLYVFCLSYVTVHRLYVRICALRLYYCSLSACRLCGRYPFHSNSPMKLEELILKGQLTFSEIEWINVGDGGKTTVSESTISLLKMWLPLLYS